MTRVAAESAPLRQSNVLAVGANTALNVAAIATFVPSFYLLWLGRGIRDWREWAIYATALGIWFIGLVPAVRRYRAGISTGAASLILASPLIIAPLGGPGWVIIGVVSFAIIVGAVFNFSTRLANIVLIFVAALDAYVRYCAPPAAAFIDTSLMHGLISPLLLILSGSGLILAQGVWVRFIRDGDRLIANLRAAEERERGERRIFAAQTAIERRIHETVLNTLAGISMGIPASSASVARQICQRDLDGIGAGSTYAHDTSASAIIDSALSSDGASRVTCAVTIHADPILPAHIADTIRDAVVEALRNVERHSGQTTANIDVDCLDSMTIRIHDSGSGFPRDAAESFGIREGMRSGLTLVGGTASVETSAIQGTTVTLTLPISALSTISTQPNEVPLRVGLIDGSLTSRIGMLGTIIFLLSASWVIAEPLPTPQVVLLAIVTYVFVNIALCFGWNTRARIPLTIAGICAGLGVIIHVATSAPDCSDVSSVSWLMYGVSGGGTLLLLNASRHRAIQLGIVAAFALTGLTLARAMPASCRVEPLVAAFIVCCYMVSVAYVIVWVDRNMAAQQQRAAAIWERILNERVERDLQVATRESWDLLTTSTRDLLQGVAAGTLAVDDPLVRATAATEATMIRTRLGVISSSRRGHDTPFTVFLTQLTDVAARFDTTIDGDEVEPLTRLDPYPAELVDFIEGLIAQCAGSEQSSLESVGIRALVDTDVDELIISLPATGLDLQVSEIYDCRIEVLAASDSDACTLVSIRRPQI